MAKIDIDNFEKKILKEFINLVLDNSFAKTTKEKTIKYIYSGSISMTEKESAILYNIIKKLRD